MNDACNVFSCDRCSNDKVFKMLSHSTFSYCWNILLMTTKDALDDLDASVAVWTRLVVKVASQIQSCKTALI